MAISFWKKLPFSLGFRSASIWDNSYWFWGTSLSYFLYNKIEFIWHIIETISYQQTKLWKFDVSKMTSIIRLRPLSGGAHSETPHCHLLEVDQFTFLLDVGWDSKFSPEIIEELRKVTNRIDAVLITYPDQLHIGALPYLVGKLGLSCPIYATVPVHKMGQMFLYDIYQARCVVTFSCNSIISICFRKLLCFSFLSRHCMEEFDLFTLDDIDKAFDIIIQVKYNQVYL